MDSSKCWAVLVHLVGHLHLGLSSQLRRVFFGQALHQPYVLGMSPFTKIREICFDGIVSWSPRVLAYHVPGALRHSTFNYLTFLNLHPSLPSFFKFTPRNTIAITLF